MRLERDERSVVLINWNEDIEYVENAMFVEINVVCIAVDNVDREFLTSFCWSIIYEYPDVVNWELTNLVISPRVVENVEIVFPRVYSKLVEISLLIPCKYVLIVHNPDVPASIRPVDKLVAYVLDNVVDIEHIPGIPDCKI